VVQGRWIMARLTREELDIAKAWMKQADQLLPLLAAWEAQILLNVLSEWAKCSLTRDDYEILAMIIKTVEERMQKPRRNGNGGVLIGAYLTMTALHDAALISVLAVGG
jgi:hypothetical protein